MAKKNNLLDIMTGKSSGTSQNASTPNNTLLDIMNGKQTQATQSASIGRSIDSQKDAWNKALADQSSTFKTWNPDVDTTPQKTTPLLSFTDEWKQQQEQKKAEAEQPKKKGWFASLIENANKQSEENPWIYDATNSFTGTTAPTTTPDVEPPKPIVQPEEKTPVAEPYTDENGVPKTRWSRQLDEELENRENFNAMMSLDGQDHSKDAYFLTAEEYDKAPAWKKALSVLKSIDRNAGNAVLTNLSGLAASALGEGTFANELYTIIGTTLNMFGADIDVNKNPASELNQTRLTRQQYDAEHSQDMLQNDPVARAFDKYGTMVATQLPSALLSIMTAGMAAPLGATTESLNFISAINNSKGMAKFATMAANGLKTVAENPQFWMSYSQESGSAYNEALADGASPEVASLYSSTYAVLSAIIEIGGGDENLGGMQNLPAEAKKAFQAGDAKRAAWEFTKSILGEIGEEEQQDVVSKILKGMYKDVPLYSTEDEDAVINPKRMLETARDTAITTAILGGGQTAVMKGLDAISRSKAKIASSVEFEKELKDAGYSDATASELSDLLAKAEQGMNLTKEEQQFLINNSNALEKALNIYFLMGQTTESAPTASKRSEIETGLDTATPNQSVQQEPATTVPQPSPQTTGVNPSKASQIESNLDNLEPNQLLNSLNSIREPAEPRVDTTVNKRAEIETNQDTAKENPLVREEPKAPIPRQGEEAQPGRPGGEFGNEEVVERDQTPEEHKERIQALANAREALGNANRALAAATANKFESMMGILQEAGTQSERLYGDGSKAGIDIDLGDGRTLHVETMGDFRRDLYFGIFNPDGTVTLINGTRSSPQSGQGYLYNVLHGAEDAIEFIQKNAPDLAAKLNSDYDSLVSDLTAERDTARANKVDAEQNLNAKVRVEPTATTGEASTNKASQIQTGLDTAQENSSSIAQQEESQSVEQENAPVEQEEETAPQAEEETGTTPATEEVAEGEPNTEAEAEQAEAETETAEETTQQTEEETTSEEQTQQEQQTEEEQTQEQEETPKAEEQNENPFIQQEAETTPVEQKENPLVQQEETTTQQETSEETNTTEEQTVEERLEEIRQEIADLEQQVPSAERNEAILRLVDEQNRLTQEVASQTQQASQQTQQTEQQQQTNENEETTVAEEQEEQTQQKTGRKPRTNQGVPSEPNVPPVGKNSNPTGKEKVSQTSTNSMRTTAERNGAEQEAITYVPKSERESLNAAMNRVDADAVGEMDRLANKQTWTGEDMDTAFTIYGKLKFDAVKNNDSTAADAWARIVQKHGEEAGRALQALSKWARTGTAAAVNAANKLAEASNLTQEQKDEITKAVKDLADRYDATEDNDLDSIRQIILDLSELRNTGTFAKKNLAKILNKINDFDWLKEVALRQLMAVPNDYTETADLGKRVKTWQVNAQLTRLGTFFRNIGGNLTFTTLDTLSQDFLGWWIDSLVGAKTGTREVGLDLGWLSKDARAAATDALNRSIVEVACDVNMEGDSTRYGTTSSRTNKMTGKPFERFMSRWEQLLGYSLTSSDRYFRGKIEESYSEWLTRLANKNNGGKPLSEQEQARIKEVASMMADYRLFQNDGTAAKLSKGIHDVLNLIGFGGDVNGVTRKGGFGLGDLVNAYPRVPANLAVKALEYSPANIAKGFYEIAKLIKDTNNGVAVTGQQMQAVMDIARGITGVPLIALFAAFAKKKVFKNSDDEDDYDVASENAAQGLSGVQWNIDATLRSLNGGTADWMDGDSIMKISWLEPLNQFMAIASLIAESDEDRTFASMSNSYLEGTIQGVLDLPVMENMQNIINTLQYSSADTIWGKAGDAAAQFGGSAVSGMLPAPLFSQLARVTDDYYRDTSGNTKVESAFNSLLNTIPFARNTLPVKTDNFGNEKLNEPNVLNRVLNSYVRPGAVNTFMETAVQDEIAKIYEATGDSSVYPERKGVKKITNGNKTYELTAEEQQQYHLTAGSLSEKYISDFIKTPFYDKLTDEQKASVISKLNTTAKEVAKSEYLKTQGVNVDTSTYTHQAAIATIKSLGSQANLGLTKGKDVDFDTLDFIMKNVYPTLSNAERESLDSSYGRLDDMFTAYSAGISSEQYYGYYKKYKELSDNKTLTAQQKAEKFATYVSNQKGLTSKQRTVLRNSFKYSSTIIADTKSYDKYVAAGLSPEEAEGFNKKINTDGSSSISNAERFAAIEKYAKDAEMAERLWEALGSSTWTKSGKSYFKANPKSKFSSSWSGKTYSTPKSSSSSSSSSSSDRQNNLLAIMNGTSTGTSSISSTSSSTDRHNELLKIMGVG